MPPSRRSIATAQRSDVMQVRSHRSPEPSRSAALDQAVSAARPGRAGKAAYGNGHLNHVRGTSSRSGELTSGAVARLRRGAILDSPPPRGPQFEAPSGPPVQATVRSRPSSWCRFETEAETLRVQRRWRKVIGGRRVAGARSTAWRIVLRPERRYQALRLRRTAARLRGLTAALRPSFWHPCRSTAQ